MRQCSHVTDSRSLLHYIFLDSLNRVAAHGQGGKRRLRLKHPFASCSYCTTSRCCSSGSDPLLGAGRFFLWYTLGFPLFSGARSFSEQNGLSQRSSLSSRSRAPLTQEARALFCRLTTTAWPNQSNDDGASLSQHLACRFRSLLAIPRRPCGSRKRDIRNRKTCARSRQAARQHS
jgi:hypothetical protein